MVNKKINDLAVAGSVTDAMQLETDIGGATANKVTALQIKNYVATSFPATTINSSNPSNPYYFAGLAITAPGQITFTISTAPTSSQTFELFLNGIRVPATDYTLAGTNLTWNGISLVVPGSPGDPDELTAVINSVAGGFPVDSVFGRTGAVVAVVSDYDASQVDNDSSVSGVYVSDALDTLDTNKADSGANSDITSLSGLTTPLSIAQGGNNSGAALTNGKVMQSSGGAIIESGVDITSLGGTKSHITQALSSANYNNRRVRAVVATGSYRLNFYVPKDFTGTLAIKLIGYPVSGAGGTGKDIDLIGEYTNSSGASATQYTFSDTTSTYNTGTDDTRMELDITSLFPNATAGTEGGIFIDHNGIGGTINYVGVEVTST